MLARYALQQGMRMSLIPPRVSGSASRSWCRRSFFAPRCSRCSRFAAVLPLRTHSSLALQNLNSGVSTIGLNNFRNPCKL